MLIRGFGNQFFLPPSPPSYYVRSCTRMIFTIKLYERHKKKYCGCQHKNSNNHKKAGQKCATKLGTYRTNLEYQRVFWAPDSKSHINPRWKLWNFIMTLIFFFCNEKNYKLFPVFIECNNNKKKMTVFLVAVSLCNYSNFADQLSSFADVKIIFQL